ncbi:MAG TPA: hypothetical protein PKH39_03685 [Woeseiaceae bacterium]|nr:hypothetical protein [Woeseiaceae bacterium]
MRRFFLITSLLASAVFASAGGDLSDDEWDDWGADDSAGGLRWTGFVEAAAGGRLQTDPLVDDTLTLGDLKARIETEWSNDKATINFKADAWYDAVPNEFDANIRDFSLAVSPTAQTDLKIGRQVLTWGTGDLLFLNDLFPKDWVSFFAGRDTEYLKAPSNAVRATWYSGPVNIDIAWTPVFEPDVYLDGERFSFFSPLAGGPVAPNPPLRALEPAKDFSKGEFALRIFKTIDGREYAFYAYRGFFHQPSALTTTLEPGFAPLSALGASYRRPLMSGLFNAETVYYQSRDDTAGTDPLIPNDQFRLLLGYEWEAITNLTAGFQYYLEWTQDHDELVTNSFTPEFEPDEFRQVITNRLSYRAWQDRLMLSLFTFYSPTDKDFYLRPVIDYRYSDQWSFSGGANLFGGDQPHTFFNQFADNSNTYVRVRYSY